MNIMTESEYLEHFGIPGMKWGVRHGRSKGSGKTSRKSKKSSRPTNSESDFLRETKKRDVSTMSNEDLQRINTRLNLENNYKVQSKNYRTNNRSAVSNVAYQIPTMLLAATVTAAVNIYAQKGSKYIASNIDKGAASGVSTMARGVTRGIAAIHRARH